jgi:desulfoferrodoxin (superoxide reductase-like protein)
MKKKTTRMIFVVIGLCALSLIFADTAVANNSSVKIIAPDNAAIGSEINVVLQVSHNGNNFLHYTEWVYVKINGEEIKRWEFSNFDKSEDENFTRSITYTVTGPLEITAEASCNIHGSNGIVTKTVKVK